MSRRGAGEMTSGTDDGPWSPLRFRIYRSLWIAGLVSNVGTFMHLVGAGWSMTQLSSSPTLTGLVQAAWAVPGFALALHAGAFADVFDRRRLIIASQIAALAIASALGVVQVLGAMTTGLLLAGTFLESMALTVAAPAFMAMTPDLVGLRHLPQAVGLDSISRNAAQAVGPAIAGVLIAATGPGGVFLANAASFVGVLVVVRGASLPTPGPRGADTVGGAIRGGVRTVARSSALRAPVVRIALVAGVGASLTAVLPVVARQRLRVGASGFGLLTASLGVGAVIAVWLLPRLRSAQRPERAALAASISWGAGTALLAVAVSPWMGAVGLLLAGAGSMGSTSVLFSNVTLQLESSMRGRGSSLAMLMVWLGATVGAVTAGAVATAVGVRSMLLGAAAVALAVAVVGRWSLPLAVASVGEPGVSPSPSPARR